MIPYLVLADVQNTVLGAMLSLSDRVMYPVYAARLGPVAALEDQAVAGAIMWVPGSLVFLISAVWVAARVVLAACEMFDTWNEGSEVLRVSGYAAPCPAAIVGIIGSRITITESTAWSSADRARPCSSNVIV